MFKNQLANKETFSENYGQYELESSRSVYEVYIELSHDKEGNVQKNRDGSDRYYAIDDSNLTKVAQDVAVKKIRENFYKAVYQVNGDYVEKVERDGKRIYFVVDAEKVETLPAGTTAVVKNDTYRVPTEIGYVLVDDTDIENPKILRVRKFQTEDHKAEAEKIVKGNREPREKQD